MEARKKSIHELKKEIDNFFRKNKFKKLKVFASGSFLDDNQFPRTIRKYLAGKCKGIELTIESRPEFITDENLKDFSQTKLTVAIGLESADNEVLKKYNKGFTTEDYIRAAKVLKRNNCKLRTYLMVGLPFKNNLKKSVDFARKYSDEIVLINTFPHSLAPIYELWIKGKWKPLDKKQFEKTVKPFKNVETDFDNFAFVPRIPKNKQEQIRGATKNELLHPHFEVWQDYFCRFYERPKEKNYVLFVPCTYTKPYSRSRLHKEILKLVPKNFHIVVISSPGVIPYEFSGKYPFANYDWPEWEETEEIKKLYIKITAKRVENYLRSQKYKKYFCFLKPSETFFALEKACKKLKIPLKICLKKDTWEKIKGQKNPLLFAIDDLNECINKYKTIDNNKKEG